MGLCPTRDIMIGRSMVDFPKGRCASRLGLLIKPLRRIPERRSFLARIWKIPVECVFSSSVLRVDQRNLGV